MMGDTVSFDCFGKHAPDNFCNYFVDKKSGLVHANFVFINRIHKLPYWMDGLLNMPTGHRPQGPKGSGPLCDVTVGKV